MTEPAQSLDTLQRPDAAAAGTPAAQPTTLSLDLYIQRFRERARLAIALTLLGLLVVVTFGALYARIDGSLDSAGLKDVATTLITPVVALVGAVTGFYYGGRN